MATKVKVNFKPMLKLFNPDEIASPSLKRTLGRYIDKETKKRIKVGKSPVKGVGRFKAYALTRKGRGYPDTVRGDFPNKKNRPINLYLDGTFLGNIGFSPVVNGIEYGLKDGASKLMHDMFDTHNNGTHPHVPQRKFIPVKRGDKYTPDIMKGIKTIYSKRVQKLIKKMNG